MPIPQNRAVNRVPSSRRAACLETAAAGATMGLVTMPFLAVSGFMRGGWDGTGKPPPLAALDGAWTKAFRWESADAVRRALGRPLLVVSVALLAGMIAWKDALSLGTRAARVTRMVISVGFALTALGSVTESWLANEFLGRVGFGALMMPELTLIPIGSSIQGVLMLRSHVTRPAGGLSTVAWLQHLPAAHAFAISAAWLILLAAALIHKEGEA